MRTTRIRRLAVSRKPWPALLAVGLSCAVSCVRPPPLPRSAAALAPTTERALRTSCFVVVANTDRARVAADDGVALLVQAEDALAARLSRDLELPWPQDPVRIVVDADETADPLDAPTLDPKGECTQGAAFLTCAFYRAVRAREADSGLLAAVARARAALDDAGKEATKTLERDLTLYAVEEAVRALDRAYVPERHFRAVRLADHEVLAWLAREWPKRTASQESAAAFGARAAREIADQAAAEGATMTAR